MPEHLTPFLIKEESKWSEEDVDSKAERREENLLKTYLKWIKVDMS